MPSQPRGYAFGCVILYALIIFVVTIVMHFVNVKIVCLASHHICLASVLIHARDDWKLP